MLEKQKRELVQLQQNYQVGITRAKEDVRNLKDIEIKELHHKMEKVLYCRIMKTWFIIFVFYRKVLSNERKFLN